MQRTVVFLKPDAVQRRLVGDLIGLLEQKGLRLVGLKMMMATDELLDEHYAHHKEKPFFASLKKFMMSAPIVCMLWEGVDAVNVVREMMGATNGREAAAGTIRGQFSNSQSANLIHSSDGEEAAKVEEKRFFKDDEIFEYKDPLADFLYSDDELK